MLMVSNWTVTSLIAVPETAPPAEGTSCVAGTAVKTDVVPRLTRVHSTKTDTVSLQAYAPPTLAAQPTFVLESEATEVRPNEFAPATTLVPVNPLKLPVLVTVTLP